MTEFSKNNLIEQYQARDLLLPKLVTGEIQA